MFRQTLLGSLTLGVGWIFVACDGGKHSGEALFPCRLEKYLGLTEEWGYINAEGKVRIKPRFSSAEEFSDGVAFVEDISVVPGPYGPGTAWGIIREDGSWVLPPQIPLLNIGADGPAFHEDLCAYRENTKWGYLDKTWTYKIPPTHDFAMPFSDGLALVRDGEKWTFIDKTGATMFAGASFEPVDSFEAGMACVKQGNKFGIIDPAGIFLIPPQYNNITRATNDLFLFRKNDRQGLMKANGEVAAELPVRANSFSSDGMVLFKKDGQWGALDLAHKAKISASPEWDRLDNFSEGQAAFEKNGKSGYIDKTGKVVIDLGVPYDTHRPFKNGLAYVRKNGSHEGYLKKDGTWAFKRKLKG